ncbi:MAG TPA: biofilm regulation protein kinase SiaB [Azospira sp.]|nr:biofilm regulation protein kinase SiaB [Azospira sp.]
MAQPETALDILALREIFNRERIMLCFNGPITATLIEEIGTALRKHMEGLEESPSSVSDVFSVYIEMTQNIRRYTQNRPDLARETASVFVSRNEEGHYVVSAGNMVEAADGAALVARVAQLAQLDKDGLKAAFKTQLRQPRDELAGSAGLGFIDMARKASCPLECSLRPLDGQRAFFSLRVVL